MKSKKLSDLGVLCSCILSHPLYLSYFLFFSPYLVKLLAFLSPLFITTALLLLSLLTSFLHDSFTFSSFLENLIQLRFDRTGDEIDESNELDGFEEFEVYKIVFGEDNPVEFPREEEEEEEEEEKVLGILISDKIEEEEKILGVLISDEGGFPAKDGEKSDDEVAGKRQDDERLDECEKLTSGDGKAGELKLTMADKKCGEVLTVGNGKEMELTPSSMNGGNQTHSIRHLEGVWNKKKHDDDNYYSFSSSHSEPISPSLSNLGSMRKEKEWRRTLACKLFEERHNGENGGGSDSVEGMDLLWETYEKTEEKRGKQSSNGRKKEKEKKMNKGRVADYIQEEYGDEDDDEDGEVGNGQLCCLQALKFSAGKMNFGRPGFVKISKAIKGIGVGWLGHHGNHRQRHQHSGGSKKGKSS